MSFARDGGQGPSEGPRFADSGRRIRYSSWSAPQQYVQWRWPPQTPPTESRGPRRTPAEPRRPQGPTAQARSSASRSFPRTDCSSQDWCSDTGGLAGDACTRADRGSTATPRQAAPYARPSGECGGCSRARGAQGRHAIAVPRVMSLA